MLLKQIFVFILPISLCVSCRDQEKSPGSKSRVIVLCDVSNSTTLLKSQTGLKGRLDNLKYYLQKIPSWYSFGSEIYYYPVSDNTVSEQLCSTIIYDIKRTSQLQPEKERVNSLIERASQQIDSLAQLSHNSCIALSMQRAVIRFQELLKDQGKDYSNELIIISDMIENCRLSDTSEVTMTVFNSDKLNSALEKFEKENPKINVTNLNLTVRIIINSPWMGNRFDKIKASWETWFQKAGIQKQNIFFYTDKPEMKENQLLNK